MHNLFILYGYELKKLIQKKAVWISFIVCMVSIAFAVIYPLLGTYYTSGVSMGTNYEQHLIDQAYRKALNGKPIDQVLLEDTIAAYKNLPIETKYVLTQDYQTNARPYSEIFNLVQSWTGMDKASIIKWVPDEAALYDAMLERIIKSAVNDNLSEKEIAYWIEKAENIATPIVYQFHEGYRILLENFIVVGLVMLLFSAIALSSSFPDECTHRTDQLVMCTANGKKRLYWIKLFAGVTVGCVGAFLMSTLIWGLSLYVYGADGFNTAIQIFYTNYAGNITMGQACLIAYGGLLATSFIVSIFVMFMSELFHSNISAISIVSGMILAGILVNIPAEYRVLSQIWDYMPTNFMSIENIFDVRLINLLGIHFTSYQIVPLFYFIVAALMAFLGSRIYCHYQISGR